jgi:hypothetical protein
MRWTKNIDKNRTNNGIEYRTHIDKNRRKNGIRCKKKLIEI